MARRSLVDEVGRLIDRANAEAEAHHNESLRHTEAAAESSRLASAAAVAKSEAESLRKALSAALGR